MAVILPREERKGTIALNLPNGLTVPAVAVTRINGQYFAFVAEPAGKGFVAHQRSVKLGDLVGNDYIVVDGLKAGERLIVSGVQKIGEGAPVQPKES